MPPTDVSASIGLRPPGPQASAASGDRLRLGELGDRLRAELLQRVGVAIDGMAAPVEAERFLLEAELLGLGPRRRLRQRAAAAAVGRARGQIVVARRRTAALPFVAIALRARAVLAGRVDGGQEPRPQLQRRQALVLGARRERVERAGLDQALEHALVDQPQIEILAQRVERRMRPCVFRTSSSDSIAPSPTFLIAVSPKRTPLSGSTVNRSWLSLMSGGSTGICRDRGTRRDTARACRCSAPRSSAAPPRSATGSSP